MSDEPEGEVWAGDEPRERESVGQYLSSQRRLRGISLDELAARTRIPRRNLERLESGAFDAQPDGFVRGFVRTVAVELGLDAQEAVMRLMSEPVALEEDWRRWRRLGGAVALAAVALGALLALGWGLREVARWVARPDPDVVREHVYRRDAVRALAERHAAARAEAGQREELAPPPAEDAPAAAAEDAPAAAAEDAPAPAAAAGSDPAPAGP